MTVYMLSPHDRRRVHSLGHGTAGGGCRYELLGGEIIAMSPERASHNEGKGSAYVIALGGPRSPASLPGLHGRYGCQS